MNTVREISNFQKYQTKFGNDIFQKKLAQKQWYSKEALGSPFPGRAAK